MGGGRGASTPPPFPVVPLKYDFNDFQAFLSWQSYGRNQALGEEAISRNESDAPLQPPPVRRVTMDADLRQRPGKSQKGGGLRQLTIEETGLGSTGSRVRERTAAFHSSTALSSKVPRVLEHTTGSEARIELAVITARSERAVDTEARSERAGDKARSERTVDKALSVSLY